MRTIFTYLCKDDLANFWKKHKRKIVVGTAIVGGVAIGVVLYIVGNKSGGINWNVFSQKTEHKAIDSTSTDVMEMLPEEGIRKINIEVPLHIRALPTGQNASLEKVVQAAEYDIELDDGYTWVVPYSYVREIA